MLISDTETHITKCKLLIFKKHKSYLRKLHDGCFGNVFFVLTLKTQSTRENIDKLEFIKIKNL